ncbi:MAG: transposase [Arenicellales bacterium]
MHRKSRRKHSAEGKISIVLEEFRGEEIAAELCHRKGLNQNVYYRWSREFLESGKQWLQGNTKNVFQRDCCGDYDTIGPVAALCQHGGILSPLFPIPYSQYATRSNRVPFLVYDVYRAGCVTHNARRGSFE